MKDNITLYSTPSCGMCKALKMDLDDAGIEYTICQDESIISSLGITHVPVLKVGDKIMNFKEAMNWIEEDAHA